MCTYEYIDIFMNTCKCICSCRSVGAIEGVGGEDQGRCGGCKGSESGAGIQEDAGRVQGVCACVRAYVLCHTMVCKPLTSVPASKQTLVGSGSCSQKCIHYVHQHLYLICIDMHVHIYIYKNICIYISITRWSKKVLSKM